MDALPSILLTPENLICLGAGFALGVLVCLLLARSGSLFFASRLKQVSNQALYDHATRFMEMADNYFKGYVKEARKDFTIQGNDIKTRLDPVAETLARYEERLTAMEKERERAGGAITERLKEMGRVQHLLHLETGNLVKALRLPHVRGRWGEITLKKAAELAGMSRHCDFKEQVSAGSGKGALRPDMVVTLPGGRQIIVDAKVPLMAYLDALETDDPVEYKARMADHARQVAAHITGLASKNYARAFSPAPEFVVLFIPGENFFSAALEHQPDLIEKGVDKGVILATPTTLIALLKAVAYAWHQKESYENAEEIRTLGVQLFRRISGAVDHLNRLGKDIQRCAASFNRTVGALEKRVMPPARKLTTLGVGRGKLPDLHPIDPSDAATREMASVDLPSEPPPAVPGEPDPDGDVQKDTEVENEL